MKRSYVLLICILASRPLIAAEIDISTNDLGSPNPQIVVGHIANIVEHAVIMAEDKHNVGPHVAGIFANILGIVLQIAQHRSISISEIDSHAVTQYAHDISPTVRSIYSIEIDLEQYTNTIDETNPKIVVSHIAQIIEHALALAVVNEKLSLPYVTSIFFNVLGIILEVAKHDPNILNNNDTLIQYIHTITPDIEQEIKRIKR